MRRVFRKLTALLGIGALLSVPPTALAQSPDVDIRPHANRVIGPNLKAAFSGQTHAGAYNFTDSGKATKFYEETHAKNGEVIYSEGPTQEKGLWRVIDDALCFLYESENMSGGCFRVYRVKNCYYFYSENLIEREDELDRDYWTARSTIKGERPECEAALS